MSFAEIFEKFFPAKTRKRGHSYFAGNKVQIDRVDETQVKATVEGSSSEPYSVEVAWDDDGNGSFFGYCSCPHYAEGNLCKHIWAAMLAMDSKGVTEELMDRGLFAEHYDEETGDDFWDDDEPDDEPDEVSGLDSIYDVLDRLGYQGARPRPDRRRTPTQIWQQQLSSIVGRVDGPHAPRRPSPRLGGKQREAWFVLDLGESVGAGGLVINLRQREARKNGGFGKVKRLAVRFGKIPEFVDPEDRRLIELLLGNRPAEENLPVAHDYLSYQSFSRVTISPAMFDSVLPRLCATGRFVWSLDGSVPANEAQAIAWDDADPWRFRLRIDDDNQKSLWRLSGEIYRGTESVALADAVLITADGLVLFLDKLARLDVDESLFGWIEALRSGTEIEVPYADRDPLLDSLYQMPHFPDVELPPALETEQFQGEPQGRLEIASPDSRGRRTRSQLNADVCFVYGDQQFSLHNESAGQFIAADNRAVLRDQRREAEMRERSLLYVAVSRTRRSVLVSWHGEASPHPPARMGSSSGRSER